MKLVEYDIGSENGTMLGGSEISGYRILTRHYIESQMMRVEMLREALTRGEFQGDVKQNEGLSLKFYLACGQVAIFPRVQACIVAVEGVDRRSLLLQIRIKSSKADVMRVYKTSDGREPSRSDTVDVVEGRFWLL